MPPRGYLGTYLWSTLECMFFSLLESYLKQQGSEAKTSVWRNTDERPCTLFIIRGRSLRFLIILANSSKTIQVSARRSSPVPYLLTMPLGRLSTLFSCWSQKFNCDASMEKCLLKQKNKQNKKLIRSKVGRG